MLPFKKILCPTDFTERSIAAVEAASELAEHFHGELCILHVVSPAPIVPLGPEPVPLVGPGPWEAAPSVEAGVPSYEPEPPDKGPVDDVVRQLEAKGLKVRLIAVPGKAPEEITTVAREEHVDLIVITTHGYTGFEHLIFGSVAEKIARVAPCPVLIIRRSEEGAEGHEEGELENFGEKEGNTKGFQEAIESQLKDLGAKIDELKARLDESKTDLKVKYADQIQVLKAGGKEFEKKAAQLKETGGEAWVELKVGLSELWSSFDRAFSKFREKKEETAESLAEKKKSYERRIETELHEWGVKIDILKAQAEASKTEAKSMYVQQIEDLRAKQEAATGKLNQLQKSGEGSWEDVKKEVDDALADLGKAIRDALSRFQRDVPLQ